MQTVRNVSRIVKTRQRGTSQRISLIINEVEPIASVGGHRARAASQRTKSRMKQKLVSVLRPFHAVPARAALFRCTSGCHIDLLKASVPVVRLSSATSVRQMPRRVSSFKAGGAGATVSLRSAHDDLSQKITFSEMRESKSDITALLKAPMGDFTRSPRRRGRAASRVFRGRALSQSSD
jgi:hypothetical protein